MAKDQSAPAPDVIAGWCIRGFDGLTDMLERFRPDAVEHWSEQNIQDLLAKSARLFTVIETVLNVHGKSLLHMPEDKDAKHESRKSKA